MDDIKARLAAQMKELDERLEGLDRRRDSSSNVNTVRIEGAGSIWNGLAVGIALGAVIVGSIAVMSFLHGMNLRMQQAEAFQAALYMTSPRLAEEVDKEIDKKIQREIQWNQQQKNSP